MEWVKCSERQPPLGIKYRLLFVNGKGEVTFGYAYEDWPKEENGSIWINDMDSETNEVAIFWMPLPEPPRSE